MARTDIAGLLTGMPSSRPDPMGMGINSEQQRLAFGAQRAEGLQRGMRGLMGGDTRTPAEQLQMAMAQLDLSKPEDLRKLAGIQQATGDLTGAAKTAAGIRELELEGKTRTAISDALIKLGDLENGQRVLDKTLSPAAGQQLLFSLQAADRKLKAEQAEAAAKLPVTIKTQEKVLKALGIPEDNPIWAEVRAADLEEMSITEFTSLAKTLKPDPNVTRESSTKYVLPDGTTVWAAETKIGDNPQQLMYVSDVNEDGTKQYSALPTDATKYVRPQDKTVPKNTKRDEESASTKLTTAGKRSGFDNSAWNSLSPFEQLVLSQEVAARKNELIVVEKLSEPEAEAQAIDELFVKRIEETPEAERNYFFGNNKYRLKKPPESTGGLDPEETAAGVAKGATVPADYTLKIDKHGNRAYVSPDGKNYILVN
jgi:hypothetical protein